MAKSNKVRLYYGIFLIVMTAAVALAFIIASSQLYYSGSAEGVSPYEIERVKGHILVPFIFLILWVAAIIGGVVLSVIYPVAVKKSQYKDNAKTLERLKKRLPTKGNEGFEESFKSSKNAFCVHEIIRICVWGAALAVLLAAAIAIIVYAYNASNYHANALGSDILNLVKNVMSWTAAALVCAIAAIIADEILIKKEIGEVKNMMVSGDKSTVPAPKEVRRWAVIASSVAGGTIIGLALIAYALAPIIIKASLSATQTVFYVLVFLIAALIAAAFTGYHFVKRYVPDKVNSVILIVARASIAVVAITFIIVGAVNGDARDVFVKAINICTECIGLG